MCIFKYICDGSLGGLLSKLLLPHNHQSCRFPSWRAPCLLTLRQGRSQLIHCLGAGSGKSRGVRGSLCRGCLVAPAPAQPAVTSSRRKLAPCPVSMKVIDRNQHHKTQLDCLPWSRSPWPLSPDACVQRNTPRWPQGDGPAWMREGGASPCESLSIPVLSIRWP